MVSNKRVVCYKYIYYLSEKQEQYFLRPWRIKVAAKQAEPHFLDCGSVNVLKRFRTLAFFYRTDPASRIMRRISSSNGTAVGEIVQLNPFSMQYLRIDSKNSPIFCL